MTDYEFGFLLKLAAEAAPAPNAASAAPAAEQQPKDEPTPIRKMTYSGGGVIAAGSNVDYYLQQMQRSMQPQAPAAAQPSAAPAQAPAAAPAQPSAASPTSQAPAAAGDQAKRLSTPWFDPKKPINGQDSLPDFGGDELYRSAYESRQRYEQALARHPELAERMGSGPSGGADPWTTPAAPGEGSPFGGDRPAEAPPSPKYQQTPQMQRMSESFDGLPMQRQMQLMQRAGVGADEWMNASGADRDAFIRRAYQANQAARDRAAGRQRRRVDAWRNAPGYVNGVKLSPAMLRARGLQ